MTQFVKVEFVRFKAFKSFSLSLRHFNILVGPNNAGKSTILAAFRILAAGMRRANSRKATIVPGPLGNGHGYEVDLSQISIAEENIFYNYNDAEDAKVVFSLSNGNTLTLFFPEIGRCLLIADANGRLVSDPTKFKKEFKCPISFVPILGPVEHNEELNKAETARQALFNYRAARNFRNIWYHDPENFEEFRTLIQQTWPGMDIEPPKIEPSFEGKPKLFMFCPEERIPRELFWSGFGFQVWCQMLTHLIKAKSASIFLIDEADIYLHSDLQRQLVGLLRSLGPDILLATHSTEIISEAEPDEIVLISKGRRKARRIGDPSQLGAVFDSLGSNMNPILTQLAKTRRVLFVEGKDFQIIGKFARKLGKNNVSNRKDFAVVPVEGFNVEKMRHLKEGMSRTLGADILVCAFLDRDYRCDDEIGKIQIECRTFCDFVSVHDRKEIENFLLVPDAINRSLSARVDDYSRRSGKKKSFTPSALFWLEEFCSSQENFVTSRFIGERTRFDRNFNPTRNTSTASEIALNDLKLKWQGVEARSKLVSGKDALTFINKNSQSSFGVSVTPTGIIDAMRLIEVPDAMRSLIDTLVEFSAKAPPPRQ